MQKLKTVDGKMLVVRLASEAKIIETGVLNRNGAIVIRNALRSAYSCDRRVPVPNSNNVFTPCSFATSEPVESPSPISPPIDVPDLPEEDSNEVSFSFYFNAYH